MDNKTEMLLVEGVRAMPWSWRIGKPIFDVRVLIGTKAAVRGQDYEVDEEQGTVQFLKAEHCEKYVHYFINYRYRNEPGKSGAIANHLYSARERRLLGLPPDPADPTAEKGGCVTAGEITGERAKVDAKTATGANALLSKSLQPSPGRQPAAPAAAGSGVSSPAKEPGTASGKTEGDQTLVAEEIERLVRRVRVGVQENGTSKQLALLKGPLLRHDDHSAGVRYALGTMWAWGDEGRPAAILDLSLTGYTESPAWCFEMVSLSDRPVFAESGSKRWWATEAAGWNPRPLPAAPKPAENAEERMAQMKTLASRFAGYRRQWNGEALTDLALLPEPVLRYGRPLDGALFVFVIGDNNPEILLVLEAERQAGGGAEWKYHCAPFTANGLVIQLDGKEAWTRAEIGDLRTESSDPYRIHITRAKDEVEE